MTAVLAWEFHRDRLADALRHLRKRHEIDEYDRILADRAAASLASIDGLLEPAAAELVADGWDVDAALAHVDEHVERLYARIGGKP